MKTKIKDSNQVYSEGHCTSSEKNILLELDSVESVDLIAENESLKEQNEKLHQLLANQQSDFAEQSNQQSNQNDKLVDAKEATETRFETLFNNLQQRIVLY